MSIVVRFTPARLTVAQYDESVRRLAESGLMPPEGNLLHVCFGSEPNLIVSEIWESRERWEAFRDQLMPVLAEVGIDPGDPEIFEVHNMLPSSTAAR